MVSRMRPCRSVILLMLMLTPRAGCLFPAAAALAVKISAGAGAVKVASVAALAQMELISASTHAAFIGAAAGASTITPEKVATEITDQMQAPGNAPQTKAVGRILHIEWLRLKQAAREGNQEPCAVVKRVADKAQDRAPIISWALDLWVRNLLGIEWGTAESHPYLDLIPGSSVPHIWTSLRVLELELASQIKFGFGHSPLRTLRLAYSAIAVTVVALMARCPGFKWLKPALDATWPKTVDHLAATLERNLEYDPSRVITSNRARKLAAKWRSLFPIAPRAIEGPTLAPTLAGIPFPLPPLLTDTFDPYGGTLLDSIAGEDAFSPGVPRMKRGGGRGRVEYVPSSGAARRERRRGRRAMLRDMASV